MRITAMYAALLILAAGMPACGKVITADPDASSSPVDAQEPEECDCGELERCVNGTCQRATQIVYLNFDANGDFVYSSAEEDATRNVHRKHASLTGALLPYGDGPKRGAVLDMVRADFERYDVVVTDERPDADLPYIMVVLTGTNPFGNPNAISVGRADCGNVIPNSLEFLFFTADDPHPPVLQAKYVSQRVGVSIGLDPVDDMNDIMYPFATPGIDPTFIDKCVLSRDTGVECPEQHRSHCTDGQNSHSEIASAFGLR